MRFGSASIIYVHLIMSFIYEEFVFAVMQCTDYSNQFYRSQYYLINYGNNECIDNLLRRQLTSQVDNILYL